jgi:hypothetical protein
MRSYWRTKNVVLTFHKLEQKTTHSTGDSGTCLLCGVGHGKKTVYNCNMARLTMHLISGLKAGAQILDLPGNWIKNMMGFKTRLVKQ